MPCIIKNAISDPTGETGHFTLTLDEIICHVGVEEIITVNVTPDGHGDCIRTVVENSEDNSQTHNLQQQSRMFVMPHERIMSIGKFRDALRQCGGENTKTGPVDSNGLSTFPLHRHHNIDEEDYDAGDFLVGERHQSVVYYSKQVRSTGTSHDSKCIK